MCINSGWGVTDNGGLPDILQYVKIPIIATQACQRDYNSEEIEIGPGMICAGTVGNGPCVV
jgi:hypothetical protein